MHSPLPAPRNCLETINITGKLRRAMLEQKGRNSTNRRWRSNFWCNFIKKVLLAKLNCIYVSLRTRVLCLWTDKAIRVFEKEEKSHKNLLWKFTLDHADVFLRPAAIFQRCFELKSRTVTCKQIGAAEMLHLDISLIILREQQHSRSSPVQSVKHYNSQL